MHGPRLKASPASTVKALQHSHEERDGDRERLIDDLAFLVVQQHRRQQRAGPDDAPTTGEPSLNLNGRQERGIST